jgi:hypothetical protein
MLDLAQNVPVNYWHCFVVFSLLRKKEFKLKGAINSPWNPRVRVANRCHRFIHLELSIHFTSSSLFQPLFWNWEPQITTSETVIRKLKKIFAKFGIPEKVVSHNDPQYSSQEFNRFAKGWNFSHTTSSPIYPSLMDLLRRQFKQLNAFYQRPNQYPLPPLDIGFSPSQLLMCCRLRSILPSISTSLKPEVPNLLIVHSEMELTHKRQTKYYDSGAKTPFLRLIIRLESNSQINCGNLLLLHKRTMTGPIRSKLKMVPQSDVIVVICWWPSNLMRPFIGNITIMSHFQISQSILYQMIWM